MFRMLTLLMVTPLPCEAGASSKRNMTKEMKSEGRRHWGVYEYTMPENGRKLFVKYEGLLAEGLTIMGLDDLDSLINVVCDAPNGKIKLEMGTASDATRHSETFQSALGKGPKLVVSGSPAWGCTGTSGDPVVLMHRVHSIGATGKTIHLSTQETAYHEVFEDLDVSAMIPMFSKHSDNYEGEDDEVTETNIEHQDRESTVVEEESLVQHVHEAPVENAVGPRRLFLDDIYEWGSDLANDVVDAVDDAIDGVGDVLNVLVSGNLDEKNKRHTIGELSWNCVYDSVNSIAYIKQPRIPITSNVALVNSYMHLGVYLDFSLEIRSHKIQLLKLAVTGKVDIQLNPEIQATSNSKVPLYNWYNPNRGDNIAAVGDWVKNHGYSKNGLIGHIFSTRRPGTVPLYNWWNPSRKDNFAARGDWPKTHGYFKGGGAHGSSSGIVGYIYATKQQGTVPLHNWWNPGTKDNFAAIGDWPKTHGYTKYALLGYISRTHYDDRKPYDGGSHYDDKKITELKGPDIWIPVGPVSVLMRFTVPIHFGVSSDGLSSVISVENAFNLYITFGIAYTPSKGFHLIDEFNTEVSSEKKTSPTGPAEVFAFIQPMLCLKVASIGGPCIGLKTGLLAQTGRGSGGSCIDPSVRVDVVLGYDLDINIYGMSLWSHSGELPAVSAQIPLLRVCWSNARKKCSRPFGWCTHAGATFKFTDCDGDGIADPYCKDWNGGVGVIGSASSCWDTWPWGNCQTRRLTHRLLEDEIDPINSGIAFFGEIRARASCSHMPIILMSCLVLSRFDEESLDVQSSILNGTQPVHMLCTQNRDWRLANISLGKGSDLKPHAVEILQLPYVLQDGNLHRSVKTSQCNVTRPSDGCKAVYYHDDTKTEPVLLGDLHFAASIAREGLILTVKGTHAQCFESAAVLRRNVQGKSISNKGVGHEQPPSGTSSVIILNHSVHFSTLTSPAIKGDTVVHVMITSSFLVGDKVQVGHHNQDESVIKGLSCDMTILLSTPLGHDHVNGTLVIFKGLTNTTPPATQQKFAIEPSLGGKGIGHNVGFVVWPIFGVLGACIFLLAARAFLRRCKICKYNLLYAGGPDEDETCLVDMKEVHSLLE